METKHLIRGWRRTYSGDGVILSIHAEHAPALLATVASVRAVPSPKTDVDVLIEWFAAT